METQIPIIIPLKDIYQKGWLSSFLYRKNKMHVNGILFLFLMVLLITEQYCKADPNSFQSDKYATSTIRYRLVEGSTLVENSQVEDKPSIKIPIRGYFWLKQLPSDPLFSNYSVNHLKFQSTNSTSLSYSGSLNGTFRVGGEVARLQQMVLKGSINNSKSVSIYIEILNQGI